jgi:uncharacterized repeat protein (TIGR03803 family)
MDRNRFHSFGGSGDGLAPNSTLVFDVNGALYGTTQSGGNGGCDVVNMAGCGTVFQLVPPSGGTGPWTETVLYEFTGAVDGFGPAGLVLDAEGALDCFTANYLSLKATPDGFGANGAVVEITPPAVPGGPWTGSILYSFATGGDGGDLSPALIADNSGSLYGAALIGGLGACTEAEELGFPVLAVGCGVVYQLTPPTESGQPWIENVLYRFAGASDGAVPSGLAIGNDGVLYGTTATGGSVDSVCPSGCGTIFSLTSVFPRRRVDRIYSLRISFKQRPVPRLADRRQRCAVWRYQKGQRVPIGFSRHPWRRLDRKFRVSGQMTRQQPGSQQRSSLRHYLWQLDQEWQVGQQRTCVPVDSPGGRWRALETGPTAQLPRRLRRWHSAA